VCTHFPLQFKSVLQRSVNVKILICSRFKSKTLKTVEKHESMAVTLHYFFTSNFIGFHRALSFFLAFQIPVSCSVMQLSNATGSCIIKMPEELLNGILYVWNYCAFFCCLYVGIKRIF